MEDVDLFGGCVMKKQYDNIYLSESAIGNILEMMYTAECYSKTGYSGK